MLFLSTLRPNVSLYAHEWRTDYTDGRIRLLSDIFDINLISTDPCSLYRNVDRIDHEDIMVGRLSKLNYVGTR